MFNPIGRYNILLRYNTYLKMGSVTTKSQKDAPMSVYDLAFKTFIRLEQENVEYSRNDVEIAREKATIGYGMTKFETEEGLVECWEIAHVLTSVYCWGGGKCHIVDEYMKQGVEHFFASLLHKTNTNTQAMSVMGFMVDNIGAVNEPYYLLLLRAHLYGFPGTLWYCHDVNYGNTSGAIMETYNEITALHFCCLSDAIPAKVMKQLLEADISVDLCTDEGDTPLMLASYRADGEFPTKLKHLITYGASIDIYNICLQNCLHLAIAGENLEGLHRLMDARRERIRCDDTTFSLVDYDTRLQDRTPLDPDPLHFGDENHETPLTIAVNYAVIPYKMRMEMIDILLDAGADGDMDIHREKRALDAQRRTPGVAPSFYGLITCTLHGEFVIYATIQKDIFCLELAVDFNILQFCVDYEESILPFWNSDDLDAVWYACRNQRLDFASTVDGCDFDIHFNLMGIGEAIIITKHDEEADFKVCIRFPRGPFYSEEWLDVLSQMHVFSFKTSMYKVQTLAHRAVACPHTDLRHSIVHFTMDICNPLRKCDMGMTATETFEALLVGTVVPHNVRSLVRNMRKKQDNMMTYIFRDALLIPGQLPVVKASVNRKRPKFRSPFHDLSEDICRMILGFM